MPTMSELDRLLIAHRETAGCVLCECQIDACACEPLYISVQGEFPIAPEDLDEYLAEHYPACPTVRREDFGLYQCPESPGETWYANLFWSPIGLDDDGEGIDFNFLWYQPWRLGK